MQPVVCAAFYLDIAVFQKIPTHGSKQHVSCLRDGTFEMRISHIASEPPALFIAHTHTPFIPAETISRYQSKGSLTYNAPFGLILCLRIIFHFPPATQ